MSPEELVAVAIAARQRSYSPYSQYAVGAALETERGRVFSGCNVENVSSGLTMCAERTAACSAVAEGERTWRALAVVTADGSMPCGACRQVLAEFAEPELPVYVATPDGAYQTLTLGELYPHPFKSPLVQ